jgi:RNA polymerase sigma-70 factor (ECF subfamily)
MGETPQQAVARLYRGHYPALVAPLIRIMGSFELAEDIVQDAFAQALTTWETQGVPPTPIAWLRRTARNRAIDQYRRQSSWQTKSQELALESPKATPKNLSEITFDEDVHDDALRLIFTCCHPSLSPAAQIALTLRTVCGFTTEEAARAMLLQPTTLQQRIVRAKRKIDLAKIPYAVPDLEALPGRLGTALQTIYLVFTEGYGATKGDALVRHELCEEAIRLARLLASLLPSQASIRAVLALMLLHHSRRHARTDGAGELITLDMQDRNTWDTDLIAEALPMVELCLVTPPVSHYAIEAAIAALHASAPVASETDWAQIAALYGLLLERAGHNPVIELNAAVAVAMAGRVQEGLDRIDALEASDALPNYHLLPAARGDLLARLGRWQDAQEAFETALATVSNDVERRYLQKRSDEVSAKFERKTKNF